MPGGRSGYPSLGTIGHATKCLFVPLKFSGLMVCGVGTGPLGRRGSVGEGIREKGKAAVGMR